MKPTRRSLLRASGWGGLLGFLPAAASEAAPAGRDIYRELGLRPVLNFKGAHTVIGASKQAADLFEAQAAAARQFIVLEELQQAIGERLSKLIGSESAMVTTGAAGAIALAAYACVAGDDSKKIRQLPDTTGMKSELIVQKLHRNVYDHAARTAGLKVVEVEGREQLANAINPNTAALYFLGGNPGDWEWTTEVPLADTIEICHKRGVPVMVDTANMLPPWENVRKVAAAGTDLICISGGKHMSGPQCSGILAGRKDLIHAAWLNSNPHSDSSGRAMKVGREEMVALWLACERYAKLDFAAVDRESKRQADWLSKELGKTSGLKMSAPPFERTRRIHRVIVEWDESSLGISADEVEKQLLDGEPRIAIGRNRPQGIEFTVFLNDAGDEKVLARRMKEIFAKA
jgi:L-seryl-tRNA(Ser) seleniumtransferase